MGLQAVLLDLDDTLIVEEEAARARIRATAMLVGGVDPADWERIVIACARARWYAGDLYEVFRDLGMASWEGLWTTFEGCCSRLDGAQSWVADYRRHSWTDALQRVGADPLLADAVAQHYIDTQRDGHPLLTGAAELVRRVAASVPVAVLTNGPPDIQRLKIEQTGFAPLLSAVVISGELGVGKPEPGIVTHALELVGAAPEHAVMVGNSWPRDVVASSAAGVQAVWISHGRKPPGADPRVTVAADLPDVALP